MSIQVVGCKFFKNIPPKIFTFLQANKPRQSHRLKKQLHQKHANKLNS